MDKTIVFIIVSSLVLMPFLSTGFSYELEIDFLNSDIPALMEDRGPIKINNDVEFENEAIISDWSGDGSQGDPYIIENYNIDSTGEGYGIFIANTTYHFVIRECDIFNAVLIDESYHIGAGIILINISHGRVIRNYLHENLIGVYMRDSTSTLVQGNQIRWNGGHGIIFDSVTGGQIWGNVIVGLSQGIRLRESNETAVISNYILGVSDPINGLEQISSSSSHIGYNHFESFKYAINITDVESSHIRNNTVKDSLNKGIVLWRSSENLIYNNRIFNSSKEGLLLNDTSNRNVVFNNNFYLNNGTSNRFDDNGISQATDRGTLNMWNSSDGGNYWYDWARNNETNDADGNGILDWPYLVDISTGVADHLPLAKPVLNERGNIRINSDSEFTYGNGVVDGNGTKENPFIIEGIYINARDGGDAFYIGNTSMHFIMRDCELKNATNDETTYFYGAGLAMKNVTNGLITEIETHRNLHGVYVDENHGVSTEISTVHNNTIDGIRLVDTLNTTIKGNLVRNNVENGIFLGSTTNISLKDNHCSHNGNGTLVLVSDDLTITNNSFTHSHNPVYPHTAGIIQVFSGGSVVTNNTFAYNAISSILFQGDNAIFRNNNLSDNEAGLFFMNSNNNTLENNRFISTGIGIHGSNLVDSEIIWNEFSQMPASIYLDNSRRLFINNNTFTSLDLGLYINASDYIVLSDNFFTDIEVSAF